MGLLSWLQIPAGKGREKSLKTATFENFSNNKLSFYLKDRDILNSLVHQFM